MAEWLYNWQLEIYREILGHDHPMVVNSLNTFATLYEVQGKYAKSEPLYLQALAVLEGRLQSVRNANLLETNLIGAKLYNTHLNKADLYETDLRYARLSGAHFSGTNLR